MAEPAAARQRGKRALRLGVGSVSRRDQQRLPQGPWLIGPSRRTDPVHGQDSVQFRRASMPLIEANEQVTYRRVCENENYICPLRYDKGRQKGRGQVGVPTDHSTER